jgi:hypothetical protein
MRKEEERKRKRGRVEEEDTLTRFRFGNVYVVCVCVNVYIFWRRCRRYRNFYLVYYRTFGSLLTSHSIKIITYNLIYFVG